MCVTFVPQVSYRAQQGTTRNAVLKMMTVWIAAFLLYGPAILSWEHIAQNSIVPEGECHAEFFYNWYFLMIASTVEFFTPFITVMYFNLSIYLNIRKRTLLRNENLSPGQEDCEMNFQGEKREHTVFFVKPTNRDKHEKRASSLLPPRKAPRLQASAELGNQPSNLSVSHNLPPLRVDGKTRPPRNGFFPATESLCQPSSKVDVANIMANRFRLSRDKRVAKSLAVIVCVFGFCWAPYTLLMIIRAACHGHCVPYSLYEISFWLLWVNSAINPVLYPLCHTSFRKAFIKLLCPQKAKVHPDILTWKVERLKISTSCIWWEHQKASIAIPANIYEILVSRYKCRYLWTCRNTVIHIAGKITAMKRKVIFQSSLGNYTNSIFSSNGALVLKHWK